MTINIMTIIYDPETIIKTERGIKFTEKFLQQLCDRCDWLYQQGRESDEQALFAEFNCD